MRHLVIITLTNNGLLIKLANITPHNVLLVNIYNNVGQEML